MKIEKTDTVPTLSEKASALVFSPENGSLRFDIYTNAEADLSTGVDVDSLIAAHGLAHILLNYPDMVNNAYSERMKLFGFIKEEEEETTPETKEVEEAEDKATAEETTN